MSKNKNLHIYKDSNVLEVTLRWFKPKAYFLAFFSVFWIGFLIVWYTIAIGGGAPIFAFLVPLIHVAVGVALGYYTLCLFLNKTYVDIADGFLTVHHAPIPWWKGNKTIPIDEVDQVYVKEKVTKNKNGKSYTYALRVKLRDGSDQALLDINHASSEQMQEIEAELEAYLGIEDQPVASEFTRGRKPSQATEDRPRRHRSGFSGHVLAPVFSADAGSAINIKNKSWQIASVTQYDWNDGNSDKLLQLSNDQYEEAYLFVRQIQGLLYAYEERTMSASDAKSLRFNSDTPSAFFRFNGTAYNLSRALIGKKYITGIQGGVPVKQWLYTSESDRSHIRITDAGGIISYEKETQLQPDEVHLGLDLNRKPMKDVQMGNDGWQEEDLV